MTVGAARRTTESDLQERSHLLRRLTFGPFPGGTEASLEDHPTTEGYLDAMVGAKPVPFDPPSNLDVPYRFGDVKIFKDEKLTNTELIHYWIKRMARDDIGLHDRMMWFWHTLFTTSGKMGTDLFLFRQLRTLHTHAMGNLRALAKALVIDPAMMQFLSSDFSKISDPNENLGRELMELFLMGRGNYTEDDVRAAAQGLAGWRVDFYTDVASLADPTPMPPVTLLGKTGRFDPDAVVDQILTKPIVATHVVGKLWKSFIGGPKDEAQIKEWADQFRASDYEIAPLMAAIVRSDAFRSAKLTRPRSGVEWLVPIIRVLESAKFDPDQNYLDPSKLDELGQVPYFPPNVAGWPDDSQWLSSSTGYSRASYVLNTKSKLPAVPKAERVEHALRRCGIYTLSASTAAALERFNDDVRGTPSERTTAVVKAAILTPEFGLA